MRVSIAQRPLLEIEVRANPELVWSYLSSRGGLWRHLTLLATTLFLIVAAPAVQAALPQAVPELPFHPLAWSTAYIAARRSATTSALAAIFSGLCYDAILFMPLGRTSALLVAVTVVTRWLDRRLAGGSNTSRLFAQSAAATFFYAAGRLVFMADNMPIGARIGLIPVQLLGGMALAIVSTPLFFAVLDGLERLVSGRWPAPETRRSAPGQSQTL